MAAETRMDLIEGQKENVLPLAQGRSAAQLALNASKSRRELEQELKEGHLAFREEIREQEARGDDVDEDSLDVWHRYIKWTLGSYPSGPSHNSQIVPLLEQATRRFAKDARYKADLRYLRLWVVYSKYVECPRDIFRFLNANEIGIKLASFYEHWAKTEEDARRYKEANAIFQLGIARRAEPLDKLRRRRDEFQARMLLPRPEEDSAPIPSVTSQTRRLALGGLPLGGATARPASSNGHAFAVFSDVGSLANSETASWEDVGTVQSRKQENNMEAKPWVGERMPMANGRRQVAKIAVFKDEDAPAVLSRSRSGDDSLSSSSVRGPNEAEMLRRDPFRNYSDSVDLGPLAPCALQIQPTLATDTATVHSKRPASSLHVGEKRARVALNLAAMFPADEPGVEYTYEELVALRRQLRFKDQTSFELLEWMVEAIKSRETFSVDAYGQPILQDAETGRHTFAYLRKRFEAEERRKAEAAAEAARIATEAAMQRQRDRDARERAEAERIESENRRVVESSVPEPKADHLTCENHPPSPTINTRAAMVEIGDMFGKTMRFEDEWPSKCSDEADEAQPDDSGATEETTMEEPEPEPESLRPTQSQSQTGDFVENSFWGPLKSQSQASPLIAPSPLREATEDSGAEPGMRSKLAAQQGDAAWGQEQVDVVEHPVIVAPERRNRFAAQIDVLTPLTERTLEYTTYSRTSLAHLSSVRQSISTAGVPLLAPEEEGITNEAESNRRISISEGYTIPREPTLSPDELVERTNVSPTDAPIPVYATEVVEHIMARYTTHSGFVDLRSSRSRRLSQLQKLAKKKTRRSSARAIDDEEGCFLELGDEVLSIRDKLGEGAFATVFRVAVTDADESFDDERNGQFAVKVERPPNIWEFSVLQQVHARLARTRAAASIVRAERLYAYIDESFLLLEIHDQGTLLDVVNAAASMGISQQGSTVAAGAAGLDETVAIFFTVELLRTVEALHDAGFVHGDLKIDNCLVRLGEVVGGSKAWSSRWVADGSGSWARKGVTLIDFGRCIDVNAFDPDARFSSHFQIDPQRDCPEIVSGRPWTYEPDYHGLASIAFTLLLGRKLTIAINETGRVSLERGALKRYHQVELWSSLFDFLLNPKLHGPLPQTAELRQRRLALEAWLETNSDTAGRMSLRSSLKKIEISALQH